MKKWKKVLTWTFIVLGVLIIIFLAILPGLLRNYIEKHDQEIIGREIEIESIKANYFTMTFTILGFTMAEKVGDEKFIAFEKLRVNIDPWSAFKNMIFVESLELSAPYGQVIQNGQHFNFDDLLEVEPEADGDTAKSGEPWHIRIDNFTLSKGSVAYESGLHPRMQFDSIRLVSDFISDTAEVMEIDASLEVSTGGKLVLHNVINQLNTTYNVLIDADEMDFEIVKPYLEPFLQVTRFEGKLNADFSVEGNWEDTDVFNLGGNISFHDFLLSDERDLEVFGAKQADLAIDTIVMKDGFYNIEYLRMDSLFGLYELYPEGDVISNMLVDTNAFAASTDTLSSDSVSQAEIDYANPFSVLTFYLQEISASYEESSYRIDEISVSNSRFGFNDFTTSDPFRYVFEEMTVHADSLNSKNEHLTFNASAILNETGRFEGYIRPFTANLEDLDLHYEITGTDLTAFSPYTGDYIDYPIVDGELLYVNDTKIRDGKLVSQNEMECKKFDFGDRVDGDSPYNLPVKLAVSLLKDVRGDIYLDVPVEGDLHDPTFKIMPIVWQVLKNIVVKAVTAPFRLLAGQFGMEEDELKQIDFGLLTMKLSKHHEKQLDNLAKVLSEKQDLNIEFKRITKQYTEVERYAVNEAKYRYLHKNKDVPEPEHVSDEEITAINNLDIQDSLFALFVNKQIPEPDWELPIQKKCIMWIGEERAIAKTDRVGNVRSEAIQSYLINEKGIPDQRIRFRVLAEDSLITNRSNTVYNVGFWVEE